MIWFSFLLDFCVELHNQARMQHVNTNILNNASNLQAQQAANDILVNGETILLDNFGQNTMILKSCCEISIMEGIKKSFQDW